MKKALFTLMLTGVLALGLAGCQDEAKESTTPSTSVPTEESKPSETTKPSETAPAPTETTAPVEIDYTIEVVDLDGTSLGKKSITTTNTGSLFEALKENFDVKYTESQYGPYITQINSSIVDPNYGLMLYQNNEMSQVGVKDLVLADNDEIKFVNECWNTELDDVDKQIDLIIYKFLKKDKELFSDINQDDHYLLAAMNTMKDYGYNVDFDFISDEFKAEIIAKDLATVIDTHLFKQANLLKAVGADLAPIKEVVATRDMAPSASPWTAPFIYGAGKKLGVELKNQAGFDKAITDSIIAIDNGRMEKGDSFSFLSHMMRGNAELTPERLEKLLNKQKEYFTEKGLYIPEYFNDPVVSGACAIIGFTTLGVDIRDDKWAAPDGRDLVEILLDYVVDGYYFMTDEDDRTFKVITTPQCMAAIMNYKIARDKEMSGAFKDVDIFA